MVIADKKEKYFIWLYNITYIISIIGIYISPNMAWVMRDFIFLFYILIFYVFHCKIVNIRFISYSTFLLFLYSLCMVIFSIVSTRFNILVFANMRFIFLYPLLINIGYNSDKIFDEKDIFLLPWIIGILSSVVGLIEFFNPLFIEELKMTITEGLVQTSNWRTGLGRGLTSIFTNRVDFGFMLVYTMIISKAFVKSRKILLLTDLYLCALIGLTLSRTAIITAFVVLLLEIFPFAILPNLSLKLTIKNFIYIIFILIIFMAGIRSVLFQDAYLSIVRALSAINPTLSGRTELWRDIFLTKLHVEPNFLAFGSIKYLDTYLGVSDNAIIRLVVNYGLPFAFFLALSSISIFLQWRKIDSIIKYSIIMFLLYSITVDMLHITAVMIPFWFSLGYYLKIGKAKESHHMEGKINLNSS